MAYGFGLAVLFLVAGNVMLGMWARKRDLETDDESGAGITAADRKRMKQLPVIIFSLMLVAIAAESLTQWSMLVLVSLLALLFPLLWVSVSKQWGLLKNHVVEYRNKSVPVMDNEIMMYIRAGCFGQTLRDTSFGEGIGLFMTKLAEISFLWFALFILVAMVCVTFVGIHQVVFVTVFATQMDPAALGTTKEILAIVIMLAWSASSVLSPVNPINLLVSGLVKRSSIQIGLRDNGLYLALVSAMGIAILTIFH